MRKVGRGMSGEEEKCHDAQAMKRQETRETPKAIWAKKREEGSERGGRGRKAGRDECQIGAILSARSETYAVTRRKQQQACGMDYELIPSVPNACTCTE